MAAVVAVSTNPAIDRIALADGAAGGGVVRARELLETPGGKAAHVAMVAAALGADVRLVAPAGGELLGRLLAAAGVPASLTPAAAPTRGTYTVVDPAAGDVLEVHEPSPRLTGAELEQLVAAAGEALAGSAVAVIAGSLPAGAASDLHARLVQAAARAGTFTVVDTSSAPALELALAAAPDLVAPNAQEAAALLGRPVAEGDIATSAARGPGAPATADGAIAPATAAHAGAPATANGAIAPATAARALRERGARAVWLSAGERGSVLADGGGAWRLAASAEGPVVNAVGCGDALLGGLAAGLARGLPLLDAAALGTAAATDKLRHLHPGRVDAGAVERLLPAVTRDRIG